MRELLLFLLITGSLAGCSAPDLPGRIAEPLPEALVALLQPDTVRDWSVSEGVHYRYLWSAEGPFAVHLLEVDLERCSLGFEVGVPASVVDGAGGFDQVSDIAAGHRRQVLAAVNGDFFSAEGFPIGPEVGVSGVRTTTDRPAVVFRGGSTPWIGSTGVEKGVRVTAPDWPLEGEGPGVVQVIGGFPELLNEGQRVGDLEVGARASFAEGRHPRTAIGVDARGDRLWIVVVDGRQEGYSAGMSLPELTELFEALGADEALNLDGGGSSVMVVGGRALSRPSDATGERAVVNALMLVDDPGFCSLPGL